MTTQTIDLGQVYDPALAAAAGNNALALNGGYAGRSIKDLLGCSTWDATYAKLATMKLAELTGLLPGDYLEVTFTSAAYTQQQTQRFLMADADTYYQTGDTAQTNHHLVFIASGPMGVASSVTGAANTSYLQWNTANTNNGTSTQKCPYLGSNLHAWEQNLASVLPSALSNVLLDHRILAEERYSASGSLTDSNGWSWQSLGKVFSFSETEVYGQCVWGTKGYSVGMDAQLALFRHNKWRNGTRISWWLRSVSSGSSSSVCNVFNTGYANYTGATYGWVRPRPGFLLRLAG